MSFRKACPRTLDRPIVIFGLEPEDLVLVGLVAGVILFTVDPVPAVLTGALLGVGLSRLKAGKPPGYLYELLHRFNLIRFCPSLFRVPHLLPTRLHYLDAFPGGDDGVLEGYRFGRSSLASGKNTKV